MPFTRLSGWFERNEGRNAYVCDEEFLNQSWRRGVGFSRMSPELSAAIRAAGMDPEIIHAAIEAGMNQADVEKAIFGRFQGIQSRSLIHEAATNLGIATSDAADLLDKLGVLDALDDYLKGASTPDRLNYAFRRANQWAQDQIDIAAHRDAIARAEHIANRITTEGPKALTDIITDVEMQGIEKWLQHYERMGEAAAALDLAEPTARRKLWDQKYDELSAEFRRYNALKGSTYLGIIKAIGLEANPNARAWLATLADIDRTLDDAYKFMRRNATSTSINGPMTGTTLTSTRSGMQ